MSARDPWAHLLERPVISERSPNDPAYGTPARPAQEITLDYSYGRPSVNGVPLSQLAETPRVTNRSAYDTLSPQLAQQINDAAQTGELVTIAITFLAAGETIALQRANVARIGLLIQNTSVGGVVGYSFDRAADTTSVTLIPAGGNRIFDRAVPQGDLHIAAAAAGVVVVEYMNKAIPTSKTADTQENRESG